MIRYKIDIAPLADYFVVIAKDKDTDELKGTFKLNDSGAEMLRLMCEHDDMKVVANEIAALYDVPLETVESDLEDFAEFLRQRNII